MFFKKNPLKTLILLALAGILLAGVPLFIYNRPVELRRANLMSTPVMFTQEGMRPYDRLPADVSPPQFDIFYATDRQPTHLSFLYPLFYGNDRSMSINLGRARVRLGSEGERWADIEEQSLKKKRSRKIPMEIVNIDSLHEIGSAFQSIQASWENRPGEVDEFARRLNSRFEHSGDRTLTIFVPGFKVDFTYPVLVAAELWHYLGYSGAVMAYSWPSRQRLLDYLTDVETAAFSAQHFRMLLLYLSENTDVEKINILVYSAGARIVSQALHELRLMSHGLPARDIKKTSKIGQVIFAAPDIDLMLFAARYRDQFEDLADDITIYINTNDTALNWALRFFGWPRLGAPGEHPLTLDEVQPLSRRNNTVVIDVAAAELASAGNGHGYFVKSPWVSTDLLLTLKYGVTPGQRRLKKTKKGPTWYFPGDYPGSIPSAMEMLSNK